MVALAILPFGLYLLTNLRGDTPSWVLWIWMLIAGIGVGPMIAAFTLIVQNSVPFSRLGTATSDLTLMRQIGTTVSVPYLDAILFMLGLRGRDVDRAE